MIGASSNPQKFGGIFLRSLLTFGYLGKVYPVNPRESQINGLKTYSRVGDITEAVDFATITIPAEGVPDAVDECLAKGIRAVQIITSGFREVGEEGQKLEEQLVKIASKGIRIVGPNCFGVYSPAGGLTMLPGEDFPKESGSVAFISQSGDCSFRFTHSAKGRRICLSKVISYGNACDVNECDLLEYLYQDPETKVIAGYIEGVRDGPRFFRLLKEVCKTKPVIIWKGGLTTGGARAVSSHTGSLGGEESVWNALFRQSGAIRVDGINEITDSVLAFLHLGQHRGRRVAVVGGAGGIGVAAADGCERAGISVPVFPRELQKKLASIIPSVYSGLRNPVDMGNPSPPAGMLKAVLETVYAEGDVDTVIVDGFAVYTTSRNRRRGRNPEELAKVPVDIKKKFGKPIVVVLPLEANEADDVDDISSWRDACNYYLSEGIPVYPTLERAAKSLANLVGYYERRDAIASPD